MGIVIYEDDNIVRLQYPNGVMTIDKTTNRMISWIGVGTYGKVDWYTKRIQ